MIRGWLRQAGWRAASTGVAALSLQAARAALTSVDARVGAKGRLASLPLAVPVGLGLTFVIDRARKVPRQPVTWSATQDSSPPPVAQSLLVAAGVEGGLAALAYAEHLMASAAGHMIADRLPGGPQVWRLGAHAGSLALLAGGAFAVWGHAMRGIEAGAAADEPVFGGNEGDRWT